MKMWPPHWPPQTAAARNAPAFCIPVFRVVKDIFGEAEMHKISHKNIVQILAVISEPHHYGVLFEYVKQGNLESFIERYEVILAVFITRIMNSYFQIQVGRQTIYWKTSFLSMGLSDFAKICMNMQSLKVIMVEYHKINKTVNIQNGRRPPLKNR